jgi:predicted alpha/beta-fold hydrolase
MPRAYHSGDSDEIDWILRRLSSEHPERPLFASGVSLGGNALLKWLGERSEAACFVRAAAAICPPQDLQAGAQSLSRGFNRVYCEHFLRSLRPKTLAMLERWPGLVDRERVRRSRTFFDFDDAVTAPLHGFSSCFDYWTRSSCRQFLGGIRVPTLVINARNDPFVPAQALATPAQVSAWVELDYPDAGGHVGFPGAQGAGRFNWIPARLETFFSNAGEV